MLAMAGDFDNSMFDVSSRWVSDFEMNHSFDYGSGGAHSDGGAAWNSHASTTGALGIMVLGNQIIDRATGQVVVTMKPGGIYGHYERNTVDNYGGRTIYKYNNQNSMDNPNELPEVPVGEHWVWDVQPAIVIYTMTYGHNSREYSENSATNGFSGFFNLIAATGRGLKYVLYGATTGGIITSLINIYPIYNNSKGPGDNTRIAFNMVFMGEDAIFPFSGFIPAIIDNFGGFEPIYQSLDVYKVTGCLVFYNIWTGKYQQIKLRK
jgi:hypothetical protein